MSFNFHFPEIWPMYREAIHLVVILFICACRMGKIMSFVFVEF